MTDLDTERSVTRDVFFRGVIEGACSVIPKDKSEERRTKTKSKQKTNNIYRESYHPFYLFKKDSLFLKMSLDRLRYTPSTSFITEERVRVLGP